MTLSALKQAARLQGYIVFDYSNSMSLIILSDLYDRAQKSSAICLEDESGNKYIFIDDSMSEDKQCFALAHEIGHIVLKHKPTTKAENTQQEIEADNFAFAVTGIKPFYRKVGGVQ